MLHFGGASERGAVSLFVPILATRPPVANNDTLAPNSNAKYSALYLKRCSHTDFNSYIVGRERETKHLGTRDTRTELSSIVLN